MGINRREKSAAAYERALQVIPGGVNSPVRALRSVGMTPLFISEADGAYITGIDGNRYIDFCMSWGVFILGHNNRKVRQAIPSMERLCFVNSGTEATMSAIRVARGFTGRDILVKFEGNYHGHADHLLVAAGSGVANISNASSAGVQAGTLSGNPVAMAAGIETLTQLAEPGFYAELEAKTDEFIGQLQRIIDGKGIQLNRCGLMFTLFFNDRPVSNFEHAKASSQERFASYFRAMLSRGVYVSPSQFEGNFISACHTPEILNYVLQSIAESI